MAVNGTERLAGWVKWIIGGVCVVGLYLINNHNHRNLLDKELFKAKLGPLKSQVADIDNKVDQIIIRQSNDGLVLQESSSGVPYPEE